MAYRLSTVTAWIYQFDIFLLLHVFPWITMWFSCFPDSAGAASGVWGGIYSDPNSVPQVTDSGNGLNYYTVFV